MKENPILSAPESRQISMMDVFGAVTVAAMLLAVFAPWLRAMDPAKLGGLLSIIALQGVFAFAVILFQNRGVCSLREQVEGNLVLAIVLKSRMILGQHYER